MTNFVDALRATGWRPDENKPLVGVWTAPDDSVVAYTLQEGLTCQRYAVGGSVLESAVPASWLFRDLRDDAATVAPGFYLAVRGGGSEW